MSAETFSSSDYTEIKLQTDLLLDQIDMTLPNDFKFGVLGLDLIPNSLKIIDLTTNTLRVVDQASALRIGQSVFDNLHTALEGSTKLTLLDSSGVTTNYWSFDHPSCRQQVFVTELSLPINHAEDDLSPISGVCTISKPSLMALLEQRDI
jgi:hypothetical protein